jgi:predicted lipoprotein with Yx(FWY)xxD motif
MKRSYLLFLAVFTLVVFSGAAMAMHHAVKIAEKEGLGRYLTDTEGKTLYWFQKDSSGKSACIGGCLEKWPIYFRETVAPPQSISKDDFGAITREDGKKQTTFRGYPLYYWVNDANPGDTKGQGINGVWFVVNPDNFPPKK